MDLYNLNQSSKLLFYIQLNFNQDVCIEIFGNDWKHFYDKWLLYENIVVFLDRLDEYHKRKVYGWILKQEK
jgi:hypothetical protein